LIIGGGDGSLQDFHFGEERCLSCCPVDLIDKRQQRAWSAIEGRVDDQEIAGSATKLSQVFENDMNGGRRAGSSLD